MLEPAAPSEGMPAAAIVAPTSLASRPVSVRLRAPKLSSQLRDVMSTLLTRQMTDSASTEIFVLGVKPNLVLPRKSRAMTRLSNARTAGECCAITAAKAKALGPPAVPGAANAVLCTTVSAKAGIKAGMISVHLCSLHTLVRRTILRVRCSIDAPFDGVMRRNRNGAARNQCAWTDASLQDSCSGLNPRLRDGSRPANSR